jgi:2-succinyl-5-enolpyruvyl-6-hydroxy-3-cyclohexene-1-carboxylate synthase
METNEILSYRLARAIVDQLVSAGISQIIYSPGYRNSPMILAAQNAEGVTCLPAVDERAAAFLALGMNKAGKGAAVFCTSGTAVGNYLPAIMEANLGNSPLVVITADRPRELVGTGANQCTDQTNFFGREVRFSGEIPCADGNRDFESHARFLVEQAVSHSRAPKPGPVHLNVRFREPFLLHGELPQLPPLTKSGWKILASAMGPSREQWEALEQVWKTAERPLILLGPNSMDREDFDLLLQFAEKSGCPILAEKSCGVLIKSPPSRMSYEIDPILEAMAKEDGKAGGAENPPLAAPDFYVRIGAPLTGKSFARLFQKHPAPLLLLEENGEAREPNHFPAIVLQGGKRGWLSALTKTPLQFSSNRWVEEMQRVAKNSQKQRTQNLLEESELAEPHFHAELGKKVLQGNLFLGNSMPIRDFQNYFQSENGAPLRTFSNRGLSGIDGLIASGLGVALASEEPTQLILGDLSTLHDLSSFSLLQQQQARVDLTLWVLNNGGGEIFRVVPTAKAPGEEKWFTTPQSFDLAAIAKSFQLSYTRISDLADWREFSPPQGRGVKIIELMISSAANARLRQKVRGQ